MSAQGKCFECGANASENHHVVPRSLGGKNTIPLCRACHRTVHSPGSSLALNVLRKIAAAKTGSGGGGVVVCDSCGSGVATALDIRPWVEDVFREVIALCDDCGSEGYWFWINDVEDMRRHLILDKVGGRRTVEMINERLARKANLS